MVLTRLLDLCDVSSFRGDVLLHSPRHPKSATFIDMQSHESATYGSASVDRKSKFSVLLHVQRNCFTSRFPAADSSRFLVVLCLRSSGVERNGSMAEHVRSLLIRLSKGDVAMRTKGRN